MPVVPCPPNEKQEADLDFYIDQDDLALTATFQQIDMRRVRDGHRILNDSQNNDLVISYDGTNVHMKLKPCEVISDDLKRRRYIWIRGTSGNPYRIQAWMTNE